MAADAPGGGLRRRDREEARAPLPPRLARRRREGEAAQDRGLRSRGAPLEEGRADDYRDVAARAVPRRRAARLRRLVRGRRAQQTTIATLLLGLYRDDGQLDYVGSCAVGAR